MGEGRVRRARRNGRVAVGSTAIKKTIGRRTKFSVGNICHYSPFRIGGEGQCRFYAERQTLAPGSGYEIEFHINSSIFPV